MSAAPNSTLSDPQQVVSDLRRQLADANQRLEERTAERDEALAQQAATAEVLQVINSSPGDLAPVFDAMLEKAMRLCQAAFGELHTYDGERFSPAALRGVPAAHVEFRKSHPMIPAPGTMNWRIRQGLNIVHVADLKSEEPYQAGEPQRRALVDFGGARTGLAVALRNDQRLLGLIIIYRQEVRPFSDKQIALLQNFGAQAVIAIENARLITETREAMEQQAATAEVLKVINASPGDLAPVFDAMLDKALTLCGAAFGVMRTWDGERLHTAASRGAPAALVDFLRRPLKPVPGTILERFVLGDAVVESVLDITEHETLRTSTAPALRALIEFAGARSYASVAMRKDDALLGIISVYRQEVRPFTDKQVSLLQNFAAQAVIAMENARLITETREALEQQTATAEVLGVINASPGNLTPVFEAMLDKATTLCDAAFGIMLTWDGECMHRVAYRGASAELIEALREPQRATPGSHVEQLVSGERIICATDIREQRAYRAGARGIRAVVDIGGARSFAMVALHKDGALLGAIAAYRREIQPFTEKEIALLQNFAAQAVIAMENARLITETREALEQQTATAEVLGVINASPGDLAPVFDAMLERAVRLCEFDFAFLWTYDGSAFHPVARYQVADRFWEYVQDHTPPAFFRLLGGENLICIDDVQQTSLYRETDFGRDLHRLGLDTVRSLLVVALRQDNALLGVIAAYRQEVRPFTDKQIALLQNFAAQAVIAMENVRLITETREALEQQTATAEVLQVINASPGDLAPVFDAILKKAHSLCGIAVGSLNINEGGMFRAVAARGMPDSLAAVLREPFEAVPGSPPYRLLNGERIVHADMAEMAKRLPDVCRAQASAEYGLRTVLFVPLRKEAALLGYISAFRKEVRPFADKEISVLENFAAQAVIAMENARLITETREALEQQTATAEVLGIINSSAGDLGPVFEAVVDKAMRLCEAACGHLLTYDGQHVTPAAVRGGREYADYMHSVGLVSPGTDTPVGRALRGEPVVHIVDAREEEIYRSNEGFREQADMAGFRSMLVVGLRREDAFLGTLTVFRQEVRPFSDKNIALLQNFAAQAVIAMENARLIAETREALEQQTATAEVLGVINASPGDLAPVFEAMLEKALTLCGATYGTLATFDGECFHSVAMHGHSGLSAWHRQHGPIRPMPGSTLARIADGEDAVQITDIANDELYRTGGTARRALVDIGGVKTLLTIALRKDKALLGSLQVYRQEVRPFTDKQIALLQSFAAQAVIAMENARLLNELRDRTRDLQESLEYQTATSDVLKVISQSTFDLTPVLQTVLDTAIRLCGNSQGQIWRLEDGVYRMAVSYGLETAYREIEEKLAIRPGPDTLVGRTAVAGRLVHIIDPYADPEYEPKQDARAGKIGSMLGVPLLREGVPIGVIATARDRVEPFTDKQIELVRTFADQAVIAIENARLLTELRESLAQQTATAELLQVINSSPGELAPVFDAALEKGMKVCDAAFGTFWTYDGEYFHLTALRGVPAALAHYLRKMTADEGTTPTHARILGGQRIAHLADATADEAYLSGNPQRRALVELGGARTLLTVPLLKDDAVLGVFTLYRQEVRPFSDQQIGSLQNFAAQAIIAMENARLLNEIRQRQAELRVTFDNMGDGVAMFDADLRLAAWNMNFEKMLDLPAAFLEQRPGYEDYVRYLAGRGEFGSDHVAEELSRRLEHTRQELRFERTRPDGRVMEVRRNAVPGGGFVVIYSDVTERKRAEAEIRAARDAAEKALNELQTTQASLVHAQKMAALGQLTAGIAHEIKNPLNFVNNFAGLSVELLDELKEETAPAIAALDKDKQAVIDETIEMITSNLEKIAEHGKRADGIVKSMLDHSRGGTGDWRPVDLNGLIDEALNLAYHGARAQDQSFNITMERDLDRDLAPIDVVPQDMTRVFLNLFSNGFYAASKRQREATDGFRPVLKVRTRDVGDEVEIRVRDNGTGIAPEIRDKLFQPFVTTKPTGEGTGLGLSISYDIVTQQHGGSITVESEPGEGTEFTVRLPRRQHSAAPGKAA